MKEIKLSSFVSDSDERHVAVEIFEQRYDIDEDDVAKNFSTYSVEVKAASYATPNDVSGSVTFYLNSLEELRTLTAELNLALSKAQGTY